MSVIEKDNKYYMSDFVTIMHHDDTDTDASYHEHYHDFVELVYSPCKWRGLPGKKGRYGSYKLQSVPQHTRHGRYALY